MQLIADGFAKVNVNEFELPLAGTLPVPVQPSDTYWVQPENSFVGMVAVMIVP